VQGVSSLPGLEMDCGERALVRLWLMPGGGRAAQISRIRSMEIVQSLETASSAMLHGLLRDSALRRVRCSLAGCC
jgi:hypothetical protein